MWRQEDVFFALGQGIDAFTGHKVERRRPSWPRRRAAGGAGRAPHARRRSCTAPPSGARSASCSRATPSCSCRKFDADEVWRLVERGGRQLDPHRRRRHGPAADRGARGTSPTGGTCRRCSRVSSSAAVFSVPVKDRFFERFPNLMIIDSIGSTESGFNGISHGRQGQRHRRLDRWPATRQPGPTSIVLDDDLNPLTPGRRRRSARSPAAATSRSATTRTRRRRPATFVDRPRRQALRRRRRLRPLGGRRHRSPCSAGARSASTPAARRSSPRRSRAPQGPPRRVRRARRRRARRALGLSGRRRRAAPRRARRRRSTTSTPHCRTKLAGYKVPAAPASSSTRSSAPPAASPTTPGPPSTPPRSSPAPDRSAHRPPMGAAGRRSSASAMAALVTAAGRLLVGRTRLQRPPHRLQPPRARLHGRDGVDTLEVEHRVPGLLAIETIRSPRRATSTSWARASRPSTRPPAPSSGRQTGRMGGRRGASTILAIDDTALRPTYRRTAAPQVASPGERPRR